MIEMSSMKEKIFATLRLLPSLAENILLTWWYDYILMLYLTAILNSKKARASAQAEGALLGDRRQREGVGSAINKHSHFVITNRRMKQQIVIVVIAEADLIVAHPVLHKAPAV